MQQKLTDITVFSGFYPKIVIPKKTFIFNDQIPTGNTLRIQVGGSSPHVWKWSIPPNPGLILTLNGDITPGQLHMWPTSVKLATGLPLI